MMQCAPKAAPTRETETKTTVVPTHTIDLVTTYFKGGDQIRQTRENLGKLYGTKTETTTTEKTPVTAIPTARIRAGAFDRIAERTIDANRESLDAGLAATMFTRRTGRPVGVIVPAAKPNAQPTRNAQATNRADTIPFLDTAAFTPEAKAALTAPAKALETAIKGITNLFIETPQERQQREREEKLAQQRREEARMQALQEKAALETRSGAAPTQSKEKNALTTEVAALTTAMTGDTQTIRAAIERAQSAASTAAQASTDLKTTREPHALPYADLHAQYRTEGVTGTFKSLVLEYASIAQPSAEAQATFAMLQTSIPGREIVAQVESDLGAAFSTEPTKEMPVKKTPSAFKNYIADSDFAEATFGLSLNDLRRNHDERNALAA